MPKQIKTFTIEIRGKKARITPEDKFDPWWRMSQDRKTEGVTPNELLQDMDRIAMNLTTPSGDGTRIGKYPFDAFNVTPNPKSSQGHAKSSYRDALIGKLKKRERELLPFKNLDKLLVYIVVYLRKSRYEESDLDNFLKGIIDALKPFIGDDNKIVTLIAEKKLLEDYQQFAQERSSRWQGKRLWKNSLRRG